MKHELELTRLAQAKEIEPFEQTTRAIDQAFHGLVARFTNVLSPMVFGAAFMDWGMHLALSPGKQMQLAMDQMTQATRLMAIMTEAFTGEPSGQEIKPLSGDNRFAESEWRQWPFYLFWQAFLLQQEWWQKATTDVEGVTQKHENVVAFGTRQLLDVWAPSNFLATNPAVGRLTRECYGSNLLKGYSHFLDDFSRWQTRERPACVEEFEVGRNVGVTPGKVVFRNRLMELILYSPTTEQVKDEPILFIPAWIMKYYILDLSASNSLVRYLVEQGFSVFMISWHNPTKADADLGLEDYRRLGVMAAIDTISSMLPGRKIHAAGYCLGGTLLAIAAATMARAGQEILKSMTMIAAQVDFREGGELTLFIDESQLKFLEDLMREQGFLDGRQMAGAFQLLRSNDLIWSRIVHDYLMGKRHKMTDLIAWNSDTTRMPYKMHSEYLRKLFLDNDLAEGRFETDGQPIALNDIHVPIFTIGTERDHIAPWKSVFKIHLLARTDVTFLLTSSGHNAGIVSEIGHPGRHYRVRTKALRDLFINSDRWLATTKKQQGSWWPEWVHWLDEHSSGERPPLRTDTLPGGNTLGNAPGIYVLEA